MQLESTNVLQSIIDFNQQAGLLDAGYDDFLESSFQIEEALEGLRDLPYLATRLHSEQESHEANFNPRECSRQIVRLAMMDDRTPLSDVARFDKHLDSMIFDVGALAKLGLNSDQILRGLAIVMQANFTKLNAGRDEFGKQLKPADFVPPEPQLQAILDER